MYYNQLHIPVHLSCMQWDCTGLHCTSAMNSHWVLWVNVRSMYFEFEWSSCKCWMQCFSMECCTLSCNGVLDVVLDVCEHCMCTSVQVYVVVVCEYLLRSRTSLQGWRPSLFPNTRQPADEEHHMEWSWSLILILDPDPWSWSLILILDLWSRSLTP